MSEKELIEACIKENRSAQQALFNRFAGKMMTVCLRYARHRMEAEDLLQDAFIKVFNHLKSFEGKGSFEGWIRRIVVNTALKAINKQAFINEDIGLEQLPDGGAPPTVLSQLSEKELLGLIAQLPDGYKAVFNLYVIDGYSHKEIGEMLQIEESTSRSQLVKARHYLQNQIYKLDTARYLD